jgi:hypothetical protein
MYFRLVLVFKSHAMAQAVSRRPLTAEALVRSKIIPCEFRGGQNGRRIDFSRSTYALPGQYHVTNVPYPPLS